MTFADFFGFLQAHEVLGGIAEQVMGFADADLSSNEHLEGHNSPYDMVVARLQALGYFVSTYRLNMSSWLHYPKRDRMYMVYLKAELGGASAIAWIDAAMQDWPEQQQPLNHT